MKKFAFAMVIIIFIGILLTGIGCAIFFSKGVNVEDLEYTEKSFESEEEISSLNLNLQNAHKVILERGEKCSVKYFDTNVTTISVSVENGKLKISESGWDWKNWLKRIFYKFKSTDVVITVPENATLDIKGAFSGAMEATLPSWQYGNISLDVSGAATVVANGITAEDISLTVSGAATFNLTGKVNAIKTHASGSMKLICDSLECPRIDVRSSGSSNLNLTGTGGELYVHSSGSSKIYAKNFTLDKADIESSGSVDAELNVSTLLKIDTSGSSDIAYWGEAEVVKSTSGTSKVEHRS